MKIFECIIPAVVVWICIFIESDPDVTFKGFCNGQGYINKGMRWSTAHGYLRPAMDRPNLDVAIRSNARKVQFSTSYTTIQENILLNLIL